MTSHGSVGQNIPALYLHELAANGSTAAKRPSSFVSCESSTARERAFTSYLWLRWTLVSFLTWARNALLPTHTEPRVHSVYCPAAGVQSRRLFDPRIRDVHVACAVRLSCRIRFTFTVDEGVDCCPSFHVCDALTRFTPRGSVWPRRAVYCCTLHSLDSARTAQCPLCSAAFIIHETRDLTHAQVLLDMWWQH